MTDDRRGGLTRALPDDLPIDFRLDPPSHSREEPAGLSDPAPASGEPAAAVVGPAAGSGGDACDHRDTTHHTRADGVTVCAFCGASLGWGAETWSNGVPNWHLDPATPSPPPAASISRAAAEGRAGSLVAQAEAVGIRPIPGAASGWREAVAELRTELGIRLMAFPDGARVSALELRLDQSTEAWTLGVAHLTERVRALGDEVRVVAAELANQHDRILALDVASGGADTVLEDRIRDLELLADAHRDATPTPTPTPTPPDTSAELAVYRERERCVRLALAVHEYELAARIAAGVP